MADRALIGRERASFAEDADIDEFVATLERFERGEISAEAWRKFRLVRGTYGQRQDDVQMLRVKIPQGVLTALQVESLADVAGALRARLRARHHAAEHPVPFPEAGGCRDGDAADGRRGHHDARSVRQLGAQHHRVPVRRRRRRRGVRRHAVCGGADAISAASSACARCCRASSRLRSRGAPRITPSRRSTIWAGPRASRRARDSRPRLPAHRRRRHVDSAGHRPRAVRLPAGERDARTSPKRSSACITGSAITSIGSATG